MLILLNMFPICDSNTGQRSFKCKNRKNVVYVLVFPIERIPKRRTGDIGNVEHLQRIPPEKVI